RTCRRFFWYGNAAEIMFASPVVGRLSGASRTHYHTIMPASGQTRSCGPCRLNVRFARKRTGLTPLADLGRSAWQAPLHHLHAAGIAAADDDTEIGARLPERLLVNVGLGGCILDDARLLGATCELLAQEMQRALAALGWLREDRGRGFASLARLLALRFLDLVCRLILDNHAQETMGLCLLAASTSASS